LAFIGTEKLLQKDYLIDLIGNIPPFIVNSIASLKESGIIMHIFNIISSTSKPPPVERIEPFKPTMEGNVSVIFIVLLVGLGISGFFMVGETIGNLLKFHMNRLKILQSENAKSVNLLQSDEKMLFREVRDRNLIINGLVDNADENDDQLYNKVSGIILSVTGDCNIKPGVVYRIGKFSDGKARAVRVKFLTTHEREKVFSCRINAAKSVCIKADLECTECREKEIVSQKSMELQEIGIKCGFDLKTSDFFKWTTSTKIKAALYAKINALTKSSKENVLSFAALSKVTRKFTERCNRTLFSK